MLYTSCCQRLSIGWLLLLGLKHISIVSFCVPKAYIWKQKSKRVCLRQTFFQLEEELEPYLLVWGKIFAADLAHLMSAGIGVNPIFEKIQNFHRCASHVHLLHCYNLVCLLADWWFVALAVQLALDHLGRAVLKWQKGRYNIVIRDMVSVLMQRNHYNIWQNICILVLPVTRIRAEKQENVVRSIPVAWRSLENSIIPFSQSAPKLDKACVLGHTTPLQNVNRSVSGRIL